VLTPPPSFATVQNQIAMSPALNQPSSSGIGGRSIPNNAGVWRNSLAARTTDYPTVEPKVNVDAAFVLADRSGATGAILKDNQGVFVAASSSFIPHVPSAVVAEALAMLHGLRFANDLGYSRIQAESDNLEVIQLCLGEERIWNEATAVYAEIISTAGSIGNVSFSHCRREANEVANDIARVCFSSQNSCTWDDEPPRFLLDKLLNDVTMI